MDSKCLRTVTPPNASEAKVCSGNMPLRASKDN
jgi:hypothetical protein